jgi:2-polyprenyl-3-methyl-5-hydroxy-6-metoxy-1,4-benzoquinol methylase
MSDTPVSKNVTLLNQEYFDSLYRSTPSWLSAIRALTSFDQQTKAKPNYRIAKRLVASKDAGVSKLRILDYGAGWGTFLLKWPKRLASCWCYDISTESVRQCLSAGRRFGREIASWTGIGEQFDLVCCSHVLEHVPDDAALLRYLRSITQLGGIILLNVPINEIWVDPKHARRYDRKSLREVIEGVGLTVIFETEGDRISPFLSKRERASRPSALARVGLRTLRLLLALVPYWLLSKLDRLLLSSYKPSQLIMVTRNGV